MRVKTPFLAFCLLAITLSSGCQTLGGRQRREAEMRRRNDIGNMKAAIARLERQIEGLESGNQAVFQQLEEVRELLERERSECDARLAAIDHRLNGEVAAREELRKAVVNDLSKKVSSIMNTRTAATGRSDSGYEHVVKAGQTLSEIAAVYHVKVSVIVRENGLKNPDDIKVGQKLFIPE